jgi:hypothetical protein
MAAEFLENHERIWKPSAFSGRNSVRGAEQTAAKFLKNSERIRNPSAFSSRNSCGRRLRSYSYTFMSHSSQIFVFWFLVDSYKKTKISAVARKVCLRFFISVESGTFVRLVFKFKMQIQNKIQPIFVSLQIIQKNLDWTLPSLS